MSSTGALQSAAAAIYNNNNKTSHAFVSACALSAEVLYKNDPASVTAGLTQGYQKVYYMPNVYSDLSLVEAKRAGLDKSLVFDKVGVLNIATFNKSFVELPKFAGIELDMGDFPLRILHLPNLKKLEVHRDYTENLILFFFNIYSLNIMTPDNMKAWLLRMKTSGQGLYPHTRAYLSVTDWLLTAAHQNTLLTSGYWRPTSKVVVDSLIKTRQEVAHALYPPPPTQIHFTATAPIPDPFANVMPAAPSPDPFTTIMSSVPTTSRLPFQDITNLPTTYKSPSPTCSPSLSIPSDFSFDLNDLLQQCI